ncbi:unnamed protein product [Cladocopium goreaui]|uniref:Uncharacterized protein n=1 Tax=Cladocopium goreaui TaxID=2562237 RepID=A0A9P1DDT5_9DINO|nr:unnamed protein product [Cladocopium goreaui]CAI4008138.1 unnamed protein product [Cladocopium goreaui]
MIPDAVASALFELVQGGNKKQLLEELRIDYEKWCMESGVPHAARASRKLFTLDVITPSTTAYAHISQKILKGAAARMIVFWMALILEKIASQPGASVPDKASFRSNEPVEKLKKAYFQWRRAATFLANKSLEEQQLLWPVYPKSHQMEHLFLDWVPMAGNCLYYGLMLDEDLMGKLKQILSHTHTRTMSTAALYHYATAVSLHWFGRTALGT